MFPKIVWPHSHRNENPFGNKGNFRPLTITFHSSSLDNLSDEENRVREILFGLATLEQVQAMSFDENIFPQIVVDNQESVDDHINLRVFDLDKKVIFHGGVYKSWLEEGTIVSLMNMFGSYDEMRFSTARQDVLCVRAHAALNRDIFVTASKSLLENRIHFEDVNILGLLEALKLICLFLRANGEDEWVSEVNGKVRHTVSNSIFYEFLTRGRLPESWKYISSFKFHSEYKKLIELGRSLMSRSIRALQARDEIAKLFCAPSTSSTKELISYHFDYLTLLLTAALDVQAQIINTVYGFGLNDLDCGLRRGKFKKKIKSVISTKEIGELLDKEDEFIDILFTLRNMIHSVSLKDEKSIPEEYPNEFLDKIYNFDDKSHWGIKKEKVDIVKNGHPPVPSFNFLVDKYFLACNLLDRAFELIDSIMKKTNPKDYLDNEDISKIKINAPVEMTPYIQLYLLQG